MLSIKEIDWVLWTMFLTGLLYGISLSAIQPFKDEADPPIFRRATAQSFLHERAHRIYVGLCRWGEQLEDGVLIVRGGVTARGRFVGQSAAGMLRTVA